VSQQIPTDFQHSLTCKFTSNYVMKLSQKNHTAPQMVCYTLSTISHNHCLSEIMRKAQYPYSFRTEKFVTGLPGLVLPSHLPKSVISCTN